MQWLSVCSFINRKIVQHGRDSVSESLRDLFYHFHEFMWQARCEQKKTFLFKLTVLNKHLIRLDGRNHRILNGRSEQSGLRLRAMTIRFTLYWYAGNWKSCNVCRIFSVKAIFETRESRPKLISSTREQNFQKCPALVIIFTSSLLSTEDN